MSRSKRSTNGTTWTCDVTGADALAVIDWAQRQAGDRLTYAVALVRDEASSDPQNPGRGLVWLVGVDGNDTPAQSPAERAVQQRMLGRRAHQVAVPPQDCLPTGAPDPFNDGTCERPAP